MEKIPGKCMNPETTYIFKASRKKKPPKLGKSDSNMRFWERREQRPQSSEGKWFWMKNRTSVMVNPWGKDSCLSWKVSWDYTPAKTRNKSKKRKTWDPRNTGANPMSRTLGPHSDTAHQQHQKSTSEAENERLGEQSWEKKRFYRLDSMAKNLGNFMYI